MKAVMLSAAFALVGCGSDVSNSETTESGKYPGSSGPLMIDEEALSQAPCGEQITCHMSDTPPERYTWIEAGFGGRILVRKQEPDE